MAHRTHGQLDQDGWAQAGPGDKVQFHPLIKGKPFFLKSPFWDSACDCRPALKDNQAKALQRIRDQHHCVRKLRLHS